MKNSIKIIIILVMIFAMIIIIKNISNKDYKNSNLGNNKSIEEIKEYILSIKSYKAELEVTVKNNRTETKYKLNQEVRENFEKQIVAEPEEISGVEFLYKDGTLEVKNSKIGLSKIYENYPNLSKNNLFLTDFINQYKNSEQVIKNEEYIILELKNNENKYNILQKLYINKSTLKPEKLEILDNNNNVKVYILYNEIEINI